MLDDVLLVISVLCMIADHDLVFGRCRNKEPHSSGILLCRVVVVGYENRRFLSRSQKRVCESATFELAFSHSRRQVDAPFLPHVSCVPRSAFLLPQALRELVSPSDWAAAAEAPASAMASCFFSLRPGVKHSDSDLVETRMLSLSAQKTLR